jgi:antitoxin HicB
MVQREKVTARRLTYTVVFEPAEEGGYTVTVPALPGCITEGDTLEAARAMAEEAILGYLESLEKDGVAIPPGEEHTTQPLRDEITVTFGQA